MNYCFCFIVFLIYYFLMAYLSWMNLIMINVWKSSVLRKWKISEKIWYRFNQLYGWLSPFLWILIGFAITYIFNIDTALDWNDESSIVGKFIFCHISINQICH